MSRVAGPKGLLFGAAALVVTCVVAFGSGHARQQASGVSVPCAAQADAVIAAQDAGSSFVSMGNSYQAAAPLGFGNTQAFVTYDGGRLAGFLSSIALSPRYKAEQDARARALNYPIGKWPVLPLEGRVVEDNPGPLEVYQANWDFGSRSDAQSFFSAIVTSLASGNSNGRRVSSFNIPTADEAGAWIFPNVNPMSEESVDVDFRLGGTVVQIGLRGGRGLSASTGLQIATVARDRLVQACS